jgi:hypothetical protein
MHTPKGSERDRAVSHRPAASRVPDNDGEEPIWVGTQERESPVSAAPETPANRAHNAPTNQDQTEASTNQDQTGASTSQDQTGASTSQDQAEASTGREPTEDPASQGRRADKPTSQPRAETLTWPGRWIRLMVTVVVAGLLVAGTVWGEDDHFPFAPFKMYAGAASPDAAVEDTRVEAIDETGEVVLITPGNTGIRRAEFEGQLGRFRSEPELLQVVVDAYESRNPQAPALQEVWSVVRWHEVRDFEVTGNWEEEVVATWRP